MPVSPLARCLVLLSIVSLVAQGAAAQEPAKRPSPKPKTVFSQPWRPSRGEAMGVHDAPADSATTAPKRADSAAPKRADSTAAAAAKVASQRTLADSARARRALADTRRATVARPVAPAVARVSAPVARVTAPPIAHSRPHAALRIANADLSPPLVRVAKGASPATESSRPAIAVPASSATRDSARKIPAPNERPLAQAVVAPPPAAQPATPTTPAAPTPAPPSSSTIAPAPTTQNTQGWAHITYISGATIYIDAGTKAGVREGTLLDVMRGNTRVAELVVAYVSSTRASCTVKSASAPLAIGDSARFTPVQDVVAQQRIDSSGATRMTRPAAKRRSSKNLRGRIGIRYLAMQMEGDARATMSQPALDARIDGHNIGGSPLGILVDIRAYRQFLTRTGALTPTPARRFTRVYQTALLWNSVGSATRVAVGRQFSSAITTIGLFDGVSMDYDKHHWSVGGFSGSQPDPGSFGYSGDVREHGAYVQLHNAPQQHLIWTLTAGGVGSYAHGKIDREFAYFQGMASTRRFSVYATEELDINRGWKATAEKSSTTPTAVYATARYSLTDNFTVQVGADSRRSIRLYRDFLNPETAFDDSFRQGQWGGASFTAFSNRFRISGDARTSSGGTAGDANSYTGSLGITRITMLQLGTQLRYTSYNGTASNGSLSSVAVEMNPWGMVRLEANAGARDDRAVPVTTISTDSTLTGSGGASGAPTTTLVARRTTWFGGDADVGIGRSWYLMFSFYRERGELQRNTQGNLALSWRF